MEYECTLAIISKTPNVISAINYTLILHAIKDKTIKLIITNQNCLNDGAISIDKNKIRCHLSLSI